jgi:hypothetical protein
VDDEMTVDENYPAKQRSRVAGICAPSDNVNRIGKSSGPKRSITGTFLSVFLHICPHFHFVSQDGPLKAPSNPAQQPIYDNSKERSIQPEFSEEYRHHRQDFYDSILSGINSVTLY